MCDPVTIAATAAVVGAVGSLAQGGLGAYGSLYSGKVASNQYKAQAKAAENQAYAERIAGRTEAGRLSEHGAALIGKQVALYGSEGLDFSGSVADVIADTKTEIEMDVAGIRTNAENRAQVSFYEGRLALMNAAAARKGAKIQAASAVIGGVTGAAASIASMPTGGKGVSVGSPYTKSSGLSPTGMGATSGNIPAYGYSYYGGPR